MDDDVTVVAPVDVSSFPSAAVSMDANQDSAVAGEEGSKEEALVPCGSGTSSRANSSAGTSSASLSVVSPDPHGERGCLFQFFARSSENKSK